MRQEPFFTVNPYQEVEREGSSPYASGVQFQYKPFFTNATIQGGYQKGQYKKGEYTNSYNLGINVPIIPYSLYALYGMNGYDVRNSAAAQNYRGINSILGLNYGTALGDNSGWSMNASVSKANKQKPYFNVGFQRTF